MHGTGADPLPTSDARLDGVRACVQKALNLTDAEAASLTADATPLTVRGWTSLAHVQLIVEVERVFGVAFEGDEIVDLASVRAILDALARRNIPSHA